MRLTKRLIDAAKPRDKDFILWDTEVKGLGLKCTPAGGKIYLFKYRTHNRQNRRPKIARHGHITVDEARAIAKGWALEVAKGGDPSTEKRAAPAPADPTFREVVGEFITKYAQPRQKTWRDTQRILLTNCAPWLDRPITEIGKRDAYALLDPFIAEGHGHKARVTLAWLRTFWRWAWKRDIVTTPLMDAVEVEFEKNVRDRTYSSDELRAIWNGTAKLVPLEAGYIKLLLLLGTRKNELAGMRWSELDDPAQPTVWVIPHERTKSKKQSKPRVYIVPLSNLARRILKSLPRHDGDLVFPGRRHGGHMDPGRWLSGRVREFSGVKDWRYHCTRHTIATWLQDQGHSEHECGLALNHSNGNSVTSHYSHGHGTDLKREILEQWASHIETVVQPEGAILLS